jgi:simple sugar transport system permease protein
LTAEIRTQAASSRAPFALETFGRVPRRYAIFIILAILVVFFHQAEPAFLHVNNLFSVLQSVAVVALLAIGVTVTLAVDGFDLSVGSIAAFTLMLSSYAMVVLQFGATATVAFALMTGGVIGLVNGLLIVSLRIPDLLATLGMMFLLAGLQLIPSAGRSITTGLIFSDGSVAQGAFDPMFLAIGRHQLFGVAPLPVVIVAIIAVVFWFLMERTRWGAYFTPWAVTRPLPTWPGRPSRPTGSSPMSFRACLRPWAVFSSRRGWDAATCSPALRCCSIASLRR